jgi:hypothetical protein
MVFQCDCLIVIECLDGTPDSESHESLKEELMSENTPPVPKKPAKSFRVTLEIHTRNARLDNTLLAALREQNENLDLKNISRTKFKELFIDKRIQIKGQNARPSSALNRGITYVDILGY